MMTLSQSLIPHPLGSRRGILAAACALFLTAALLPPARGSETLVDVNLAKKDAGSISAESSSIPHITEWTGPDSLRQYGYVEIGKIPAGPGDKGGAGSAAGRDGRDALLFFDTSPVADQSPVLAVSTDGLAGKDASKTGSVAIRFMVMAEGPFRADLFFGGVWDKSVATVMIQDGAIVCYRNKTVEKIGTYTPGQWVDLKLELDGAKKTCTFLLDGRRVLENIPWNDRTLAAMPDLKICADKSAKPDDSQGQAGDKPVFAVQSVVATDGK